MNIFKKRKRDFVNDSELLQSSLSKFFSLRSLSHPLKRSGHHFIGKTQKRKSHLRLGNTLVTVTGAM